ncbi:MAG TPA: hypothetical protein VN688_25320 [Gemmataceae bacterium]|nr:hypothetical protein [Gemmataceae bacterium]
MKSPFASSLVVLGLWIPCSVATDTKPEQVAKAKAEEVLQATLKGDFGKLADLTYPKVVESLGGRDKMIAKLEASSKEMKSKGVTFRSVKVGDVLQLAPSDSHLFALLPMTLEMKIPTGTITVKSFLLGISSDKGKTWTFFNGDKMDDEKAKKLLPSLPAKLKLPKKEKPVFRKDE